MTICIILIALITILFIIVLICDSIRFSLEKMLTMAKHTAIYVTVLAGVLIGSTVLSKIQTAVGDIMSDEPETVEYVQPSRNGLLSDDVIYSDYTIYINGQEFTGGEFYLDNYKPEDVYIDQDTHRIIVTTYDPI